MEAILSNQIIIQLTVFACVSCVFIMMLKMVRSSDPRIEARLTAFQQGDDRYQVRRDRYSLMQQLLNIPKLTELASHLVPDNERVRTKIQTKLLYAGIYSRRALVLFFMARLLGMVLPPVIGFLCGILGLWEPAKGLLFGSLIGAFGFCLPEIWLKKKIAKRHTILRSSLPNFLDLLLACVDSGLGLHSSIGHITEEMKYAIPDLASEFSVCLQQIELGTTLEDAMSDLAERTGLEELRLLKTFIQQTQKFGSSIGGALRELADTLRYQRELRAEELAQKAAVKIMIPTLLFIFPAVFIVLAGPAAIRIHQNMANMKAGSDSQVVSAK